MDVRTANDASWPAIWPFFQRIVQAGETYTYPGDLTIEAARSLWLEQPPGHAVVAVMGDEVVGTAKMGPNRPGRGAHIGTASFMVDPGRSGQGIGRALAEYVVQWHRDNSYRGIQFNAVVETNTAAVSLWRSLGFTIVGTVPGSFDHPRHGYVGMHVMFLALA